MTLAALATKTGLTKGFLSQLERGIKIPSISSLLKVAHALDVPVAMLFEDIAKQEPSYSLVRRGERKPFSREGSRYGYNYEAIAYRRRNKRMEPFIMIPPRDGGRKLFDHDGDEMIYLLSGRAEVRLGRERIVLKSGDCLYFDASIPHRTRRLGKRQALALVVASSLGGR